MHTMTRVNTVPESDLDFLNIEHIDIETSWNRQSHVVYQVHEVLMSMFLISMIISIFHIHDKKFDSFARSFLQGHLVWQAKITMIKLRVRALACLTIIFANYVTLHENCLSWKLVCLSEQVLQTERSQSGLYLSCSSHRFIFW